MEHVKVLVSVTYEEGVFMVRLKLNILLQLGVYRHEVSLQVSPHSLVQVQQRVIQVAIVSLVLATHVGLVLLKSSKIHAILIKHVAYQGKLRRGQSIFIDNRLDASFIL